MRCPYCGKELTEVVLEYNVAFVEARHHRVIAQAANDTLIIDPRPHKVRRVRTWDEEVAGDPRDDPPPRAILCPHCLEDLQDRIFIEEPD